MQTLDTFISYALDGMLGFSAAYAAYMLLDLSHRLRDCWRHCAIHPPVPPPRQLASADRISQPGQSPPPSSLDLSVLKTYKLRGKSVVKVNHVPISLPDTLRRYILRGEEVVILTDLKKIAVVLS